MNFIRNGIDLFEVYPNTNMAKEAAKKYWGNLSVLSGNQSRSELSRMGDRYDGAHLYPAGKKKYSIISRMAADIFPMSSSDHFYFDNKEIETEDSNKKLIERPVSEKIEILIEGCYHEYRQDIIAQIEELGRLL